MPIALGPPPVTIHTLVTAWQTDVPSLVADGIEVVVAALYLAGVRRLADRGRRWPLRRTASFLAGLFLVFVAVGSGLAQYDDSVFAAHMVQHMLLMMVAPIFLALGAPITLAIQASRRRTQVRLVSLTHHPVVQALGRASIAFFATWIVMYGYFLTPFYGFSLDHLPVHIASHIAFLAVGCLYCWQIMGVDPVRQRLTGSQRVAFAASGLPLTVLLAVLLMTRSTPIATGDTLADTHLGGLILLVFGGLVCLAEAWYVVRRTAGHAQRRAGREPSHRDVALQQGARRSSEPTAPVIGE